MVLLAVLGLLEAVLLLTRYKKVNKWFKGKFLMNVSALILLVLSLTCTYFTDGLTKQFRTGILVGGVVWLLLFGKLALDKIKRSHVVATIENEYKLPEAYNSNPLCWDCNSPYREKGVRVCGIVSEITQDKLKSSDTSPQYIVKLGKSIICVFDVKSDMKTLCLGERVNIIGVCTEDVERLVLERCFVDLDMKGV